MFIQGENQKLSCKKLIKNIDVHDAHFESGSKFIKYSFKNKTNSIVCC